MASVSERVLGYLRHHPEGVDDDDLARAIGLNSRQQANITCRKLAREGVIIRREVSGKLRNFHTQLAQTATVTPKPAVRGSTEGQPWFWEGNVQESVLNHLRNQGYSITRYSNTATKERGKDIEAEIKGRILYVTVKGYPKGTLRTNATVQAAHWFKGALFDIINWRGENQTVELAMAMPDYPPYRRLVEKVMWLKPVAHFSLIWVEENGECTVA